MLSPNESESAPLIGVRHYARPADAREAALVLAAHGLSYVIDPAGAGWVLLVEATAVEVALRELTDFEREAANAPAPPSAAVIEPLRAEPLLLPALVMGGFFVLQQK